MNYKIALRIILSYRFFIGFLVIVCGVFGLKWLAIVCGIVLVSTLFFEAYYEKN